MTNPRPRPPFVRDDPFIRVLRYDDYQIILGKPRTGFEVRDDSESIRRWRRQHLPKRRWIAAGLNQQSAFCQWCGAYALRSYRMTHGEHDRQILACAPCKLALTGRPSMASGANDRRGVELEAKRYNFRYSKIRFDLRELLRNRKFWRPTNTGLAFRPRGQDIQADFTFAENAWGFVVYFPDGSTDDAGGFGSFITAQEGMVEAYVHWTSR